MILIVVSTCRECLYLTYNTPAFRMGERGVADDINAFWNDVTADLHGTPLRRAPITIAESLSIPMQVVRSSTQPGDALQYLMYQIVVTENKDLVLRALASAIAIIYRDTANYTGSTMASVEITGLAPMVADPLVDDSDINTNLEAAEAAKVRDLRQYMLLDGEEIAAYFGVLCYAGVKKLTSENREAFNEKRVPAVKSMITGNPKIFVTNSPYLHADILNKVYATFTSLQAARAHLIRRVAGRMGGLTMGPQTSFAAMFMLLVDNGFGALRIIKQAVIKYQWIREDFPELAVELSAANEAIKSIKSAPPASRPFLKAIQGSAFVPAAQSDIANLLGVCKFVMSHTVPTYRQFGGGNITPDQEEHCRRRLRAVLDLAPAQGQDQVVPQAPAV